jgi:hypothetical protein
MLRRSVILACLAATVIASCSTDRRSRRGRRSRLQPRAEAPAGIQELQGLLAEFHGEIEEADFGDAAGLIDDMEEAIKRAGVATIAHADYAELSAAVERADRDLAAARKRHAIDEIVTATREKLATAGELDSDLVVRGPSEDRLDELDEVLEELAELAERGVPYRDDPAYTEFANQRDASVAAFTQNSRKYRWLHAATGRMGDVLEDSGRELDTDAAVEDRIELADAMLAIYSDCVETTRELALAQGFAANLAIETPIGTMTLEETQEVCEKRRANQEATGHNLRWKLEVTEVGATVDAALKRIEAQQTAAGQLEANIEAVAILGRCTERLAKTEEHPGFDPRHKFATHMGKTTSAQLRSSCAKVRDNLAKLQPTLRWRMALAELQADVADTRKEIAEARQEEEPVNRADALKDTLDGLRECIERSTGLANLAGHAGARPRKNELRAARGLISRCKKNLRQIEARIAPAKNAVRGGRVGKKKKTKKR